MKKIYRNKFKFGKFIRKKKKTYIFWKFVKKFNYKANQIKLNKKVINEKYKTF